MTWAGRHGFVVTASVLLLGLVNDHALPDISTMRGESMQEYAVPAGSHPHDVAPAPDGSVWYVGQASGELGRLDPASGHVHRILLGTGSRPHGVIVGLDGAPWITDGGLNAIVRVDPKTETVKVFPLPADRKGANLNTATFDRGGRLWFTGQSGVYGRLNPEDEKLEVFDAPKGVGPYGITTAPDGTVYFVSLAGSYLGRIDGERARSRSSNRPPRRPAHGESGRIRKAISGSANGTWEISLDIRLPRGPGRNGICPAASQAPMRSTSMRPTRSG